MPRPLIAFVRFVDGLNYRVGRFAMYLLYALMGVMIWATFARTFVTPQIWTDEMGQFILMGYFMLGGAYAMQRGAQVRMDVFYSRWSERRKLITDCITIFVLIIYLSILLWGGIESTSYALEYAERKRGLWRPYMAPIKIIMVFGILLMLLQCFAFFLRDLARLRGEEI